MCELFSEPHSNVSRLFCEHFSGSFYVSFFEDLIVELSEMRVLSKLKLSWNQLKELCAFVMSQAPGTVMGSTVSDIIDPTGVDVMVGMHSGTKICQVQNL